jgi:hypothetical protein
MKIYPYVCPRFSPSGEINWTLGKNIDIVKESWDKTGNQVFSGGYANGK